MSLPPIKSFEFNCFKDLLVRQNIRPAGDLEIVNQENHLKTLVVPVIPHSDYSPLYCWFNCYDYQHQHGGAVVFGWAIWQSKERGFLAQHHAVWKSEEGLYLDVTPSETGAKEIVFVPDNRAPFDYHGLRVPFSLERTPDGVLYWMFARRRLDHFGIGVLSLTDKDRRVLSKMNSLKLFDYVY